MEIALKTDLKEFFNVYVNTLNPILKLKKREREVLASLLAVYYANRNKKLEGDLQSLLFSKKVRKYIRESIQMSEASFNNHLNQLRTKKVLYGEKISPFVLNNLPTTDKLTISYIISLNG